MKRLLWFLPLQIMLMSVSFAQARDTIHVALTSVQPPFVFNDELHSGLIRDLVTELNRAQERFNFVLKLYPPSRIMKDHFKQHIDLIAFNHLKWGWEQQGGKGSVVLTNGKDVFLSVQHNAPEHTKKHTIAVVRGFHYKFFGYDPSKFEDNPLIFSLENEPSVVKFLAYGRAEKGIVSESYLNWIALSKPELFERITVLETDHSYTRRFIVMPRSLISVQELNELLFELKSNGLLERIFSRYGQPMPSLDP